MISIIYCQCRCLNQCTYCKTRHARGQLGSYSPEEIVDRAKQALSGLLLKFRFLINCNKTDENYFHIINL